MAVKLGNNARAEGECIIMPRALLSDLSATSLKTQDPAEWALKETSQLPAIQKLRQDACQCLMLHPYITASRTIVNILLS